MNSHRKPNAFTLIELSIVLVIIGLIVGGVLVGQDLIRAAGVRATISQIEKYNTAVNTFRGKYGGLPGDLNAALATQFGFVPRGTLPGQGDGNGILEGDNNGVADGISGVTGENVVFWVDLSTAGLIDGSFTTASETVPPTGNIATNVAAYLPAAKLGGGNFLYVYSTNSMAVAFASAGWPINGNLYSFSGVTLLSGDVTSTPTLTVQEAYNIDKKIDDGQPQTGRTIATYINGSSGAQWAAGGGNIGAYPLAATPGSPTTCYDNGNVYGVTAQYSLAQNNGAGVNCALSFMFQ